MGKLVVTEFITVDGVIDSPGELGWVFKFNRGDEGDQFKFDELMSADAQLLGRITYQGFAQAWPSMGTDPFGARMNSMPKFVVSTTLSPAEATWENSTVISHDVGAEVARIKEGTTGDILVAGSGHLARTLAAEDLVDEYRLMVLFVGSTWSCAASSILIQRPLRRTPGGAIAQSHNQGVRRYERIATRSWPARSR